MAQKVAQTSRNNNDGTKYKRNDKNACKATKHTINVIIMFILLKGFHSPIILNKQHIESVTRYDEAHCFITMSSGRTYIVEITFEQIKKKLKC